MRAWVLSVLPRTVRHFGGRRVVGRRGLSPGKPRPATGAPLPRTSPAGRDQVACPRVAGPVAGRGPDEERFDEICDAQSDARCVALSDDGSCLIYDHRPLICRLHGLPMYDPTTSRDCGGACDLNFPPYDLESKPALHFAHADFVRRETELLDAIEGQIQRPDVASTVVAVALRRAAVEEESHDER